MKRVFVHGWSYDSTFWSPLCAELGEPAPWLIEHGYGGAAVRHDLPGEPFVAVTHSAGALWLLGQDLRHCAGIVAVNGFTRFVAGAGETVGVPSRVIERMRRRLSDDAAGVVATFRARICDEPAAGEPSSGSQKFDPVALERGLASLMEEDVSAAALRLYTRIVWVAGTQDPLQFPHPPGARQIWRNGGHCLPLHDAQGLAALVRTAEREWGL